MTFTTTRIKPHRDCHHDRQTAIIEPTRDPSISLAKESSDPESPHTQNPNVQAGLEGQLKSNTTEMYRAPTVAQEQPSTDD
ncbi:MAG: hypothetical protein LQ349_004063 [Xanthoria aureola]|nr:MAG: hypothetical protein LQ349_004063 [Xanthoria aureola]